MYGPNWPNSGEIDIIEGANTAYTNLMSAHTGPNCNLPETGLFTGAQQLVNCTSPNDVSLALASCAPHLSLTAMMTTEELTFQTPPPG